MKISKSSVIKLLSVLMCAILICVGSIMLNASAEEINEINPELTLAKIDSNVENDFYSKGLYVQTSDFSQGEGKYNIKSNSYVAWSYNDDIAFAYKKYNVSENAGDYMEAVITLDAMPNAMSGTLHHNASAGIMFRSGLESDDAEVFLHVRGAQVLVVYRTKKGNVTSVQYTGATVKFPLQMKMVKKANSVTLSYKSADGDWLGFKYPVGLNAKGPLYVGIAAHSCEQTIPINANFSNFTLKGVGTYEGTDTPTETPSEESEYVAEDGPIGKDVIMRETFTDGSLTNKPASIENPIWPEPEEFKLVNQNGNRVWERTFIDQNDWVGGDWTDYKVSVDVQFTENCNPNPESASNTFRLYARHTGIEFYGHSHYAAVVTNGYKIGLYKLTYSKNVPSDNGYLLSETVSLRDYFDDDNIADNENKYTILGDGKYHNLAMKVFDNKITVYWDGKEMISYTDTGESNKTTGKRVFGYGNVGIGTFETSVYVDNLTVEEVVDTFGGDYDNEIGGNWDLPIPNYITEWEKKDY